MFKQRPLCAGIAGVVLCLASGVGATDVTGTVELQGLVSFAAPIPGIALTDLTVGARTETEATGNGEQCEITAVTTGSPDGSGLYGGTVSAVDATITISRGGPMVPDGDCVVTMQASATDGVSVSAHGSQTLFVSATEIGASATVNVPTIIVRQSKAIAGISKDCRKWVKKQLKFRAKCNFLLLKKGPSAALKCKDAGPEPPDCDPGDFVEAIEALSHGGNDQQTNPGAAEGVDPVVLKQQIKCQKFFGKAAVNFANKRIKRAQKLCIEGGVDSESCRASRSNEAKPKLDKIDKCTVDQMVDGGTGRVVPQVGPPCDFCIDGGGAIDRKCLKACFLLTAGDLSDGILGDTPECGNGIVQSGEFCDDGNTTGGDCCSASCTVESGNPEGPMGDPTCSDAVDNDCDTLIDGADPDCQ
jgi:cysteine-rich repeat protein